MARNPNAPAALLLRLLGSGHWEILVDRAPPLPHAVYDAVIAHPDPDVRRHLAKNPHAPASQRGRLVDDPDPEVRKLVARPSRAFRTPVDPLPESAFARLAADPVAGVRLALLEHAGGLPAAVLDVLLDDPDPEVRTAALIAAGGTRALRLWAHDEDEWQVLRAAETAPLERELARDLVRRGSPELRRSLAANPTLPAELVTELAGDPSRPVRLAVAMRQELSEARRAAIDAEVHPDAYVSPAPWATDTDDPELMRRAVESAQLGLRRSAAYNPRLPGELVARLALDPDHAVRLLLCENHPAVPPALLWEVWREARVITRHDLLGRPGFPLDRFAPLADSEDRDERCLALLWPDLDPAVVDRLSRDPDASVREAAAAHPRLSPGRLPELLDDLWVAEAAGAHPALPVRLMEAVLAEAAVPG
ncbi:LRV domain-containing protein [Streptomyces sp. NPDC054956]